MLRQGNTKLGSSIHQWSIPSGDRKICIGASNLCLRVCYATRGHYRQHTVKAAMHRNYDLTKQSGFSTMLITWLMGQRTKIVRIHASGDFYNITYARKWIRAIKRNPGTLFFGYTRSWRDPDVLPVLQELAAMPNVKLWFSCDSETGEPPYDENVRRAYMMLDDDDIPAFPVNMVFRDKHKSVMKRVEGVMVCPYENGATKNITCDKCRLCFREQPVPTSVSLKLEGVSV